MSAIRRLSPNANPRLVVRVVIGILLGVVYDFVDSWFDQNPLTGEGPGMHVLWVLHKMVDLVLPVLAGALIGLTLHFLELRTNTANKERRRADKLRRQIHRVERDQAVWVIAASLLHEIRTPIHALGLLLDEATALPPTAGEEREALLLRARAQADRLVNHLNAIRRLPAEESPALPSINLTEIVSAVAHQAKALGRPDGIQIEARVGAAMFACANPTYVQIILENLVDNSLDALRERGSGGTVGIELQRVQGKAVIRVSDDGPGLEPEAADCLFEPLRSTKPRGLGIGLSIARALARAMSGDLQLEQRAPAIFRLELGLPVSP